MAKIKTGWKKEYIQQLITICNSADDDDLELFDDILNTIISIGTDCIRPLLEYTSDPTRPEYGINICTDAIEQIFKKTPNFPYTFISDNNLISTAEMN